MKNLQQGSREWLELRKTKITATDSVVIMGKSPYKTPYELWLEKLGKVKVQEANAAMLKGSEMEEGLREKASKEIGIDFLPAVIVPENDFIMASLDGIDFDSRHILEIKVTNKEYFERIKKGDIPEHFMIQIQKQLMCVPTAQMAYLYSYNGGECHTSLIDRDSSMMEKIRKADADFMQLLKTETPPSLTERDFVVIDDNPQLKELLEKWEEVSLTRKELDKLEKSLKELIIECTDDGNTRAYGYRIKKSYVSSPDYRKAVEEAKIDMSKYRRMSIRWNVTKEKKND